MWVTNIGEVRNIGWVRNIGGQLGGKEQRMRGNDSNVHRVILSVAYMKRDLRLWRGRKGKALAPGRTRLLSKSRSANDVGKRNIAKRM